MRDGVQFVFDSKIARVASRGNEKTIYYEMHGSMKELVVDQILVGIGRAPNVEGLGLEKVGVECTGSGVKVNHRLQTTNARIYAAGDICSQFKFTHAADAMAQVVIQNALFPHPFGLAYAGMDSLLMPWCTSSSVSMATALASAFRSGPVHLTGKAPVTFQRHRSCPA